MSQHYLHKYYRGVLLPSIAYYLGVPPGHHKKACATLHDAFKEYLCIPTTSGLSDHTFLIYMSAILMLMAREKGVLIPFFNEPDHIDDMNMTDWLNLQKIIDK